MLVNYKIFGAPNPAYAPLFNEANGDTMEKFSGAFTGIVQREPLAGSNVQARFARGNISGKTQFSWTSTYADAPTAQASIATIGALKLTPVHLQLTEGAETWYLPNAISESYEFDRQGSSVTHTLTFESDDLNPNPP